MARFEQDREDLLAEAKTLVARAEIAVEGSEEPLVLGFRREGGASFYFSPDEAYHFNPAGELRRAYVNGLLYKAEKGRLASLRRNRTEQETQLLRHDLTDDEQAAFLHRVAEQLQALEQTLQQGKYRVLREVLPSQDAPENAAENAAGVIERAIAWLAGRQVKVAASPRA